VNRLAAHLQALGVGPDVLVGLYLERTPELIVALLAVLKAGGAYLPLDPSFPSERLAFMLADSEASLILTQTSLLADMPENNAEIICLDALEKSPSTKRKKKSPSAKPDDLAYIIYTSGSTGKPKGVQIHHQAVVNFLCSMRESLRINADDTLFAVTTLSFDIAVLELLLPLTVGARVVISSSDVSMSFSLIYPLLAEPTLI